MARNKGAASARSAKETWVDKRNSDAYPSLLERNANPDGRERSEKNLDVFPDFPIIRIEALLTERLHADWYARNLRL